MSHASVEDGIIDVVNPVVGSLQCFVSTVRRKCTSSSSIVTAYSSLCLAGESIGEGVEKDKENETQYFLYAHIIRNQVTGTSSLARSDAIPEELSLTQMHVLHVADNGKDVLGCEAD